MILKVEIQWRIQDFPEVGAPTGVGERVPTYDLAKISPKLHEIERILTRQEEGGQASKF